MLKVVDRQDTDLRGVPWGAILVGDTSLQLPLDVHLENQEEDVIVAPQNQTVIPEMNK